MQTWPDCPIGSRSDTLAAGYGEAEIVREVGWQDARRLYHYTEGLQAKRGPMARFLAERARETPPDESGEA